MDFTTLYWDHKDSKKLTLWPEPLFALIIAQLNYIWFLINKYF